MASMSAFNNLLANDIENALRNPNTVNQQPRTFSQFCTVFCKQDATVTQHQNKPQIGSHFDNVTQNPKQNHLSNQTHLVGQSHLNHSQLNQSQLNPNQVNQNQLNQNQHQNILNQNILTQNQNQVNQNLLTQNQLQFSQNLNQNIHQNVIQNATPQNQGHFQQHVAARYKKQNSGSPPNAPTLHQQIAANLNRSTPQASQTNTKPAKTASRTSPFPAFQSNAFQQHIMNNTSQNLTQNQQTNQTLNHSQGFSSMLNSQFLRQLETSSLDRNPTRNKAANYQAQIPVGGQAGHINGLVASGQMNSSSSSPTSESRNIRAVIIPSDLETTCHGKPTLFICHGQSLNNETNGHDSGQSLTGPSLNPISIHNSENADQIYIRRELSYAYKQPDTEKHPEFIATNESAICQLSSETFLLLTVNYLCTKGKQGAPTREELEEIFTRARQAISKNPTVILPSQTFWTAKITASTSPFIELIQSDVSLYDAINECIKSIQRDSAGNNIKTFYVAVFQAKENALEFGIVATGTASQRKDVMELPDPEKVTSALNSPIFEHLKTSLGSHFVDKLTTQQALGGFLPLQKPVFQCPKPRPYPLEHATDMDKLPFEKLRSDQVYLSRALTNLINKLQDERILNLEDVSDATVHVLIPTEVDTDLYNMAKSLLNHSKLKHQLYTINMVTTHLETNIANEVNTVHIIVETHSLSQNPHNQNIDELKTKLKRQNKKVVWIYSTEIPYGLYTRNSKFSVSKELHIKQNEPREYRGTQYHIKQMNECFPSIYCDPQFEQAVDASKSHTSRTSNSSKSNYQTDMYWSLPDVVVRGCVLVEQLASAMVYVANTSPCEQYSTPSAIEIMMSALNERWAPGNRGPMIILRVLEHTFAKYIYDRLTQVYTQLELPHDHLEIVLYKPNEPIKVSEAARRKISSWNGEDFKIECLKDLEGLPSLLIYSGPHVFTHEIPRSVRCVDLRLACLTINRTTIESELSLASCIAPFPSHEHENDHNFEQKEGGSGLKKQSSKLTSPERQAASDSLKKPDDGARGSPTGPTESKKPKISENQKTESNCENAHMEVCSNSSSEKSLDEELWRTPKILVSQHIYNVLKPDRLTGSSVTKIKPHAYVTWTSSTRPFISETTSPEATSTYYREWCIPMHGHPDYNDDKSLVKKQDQPKTLLIHSPPGTQLLETTLQACQDFCAGLRLQKQIKVFYPVDSALLSSAKQVKSVMIQAEKFGDFSEFDEFQPGLNHTILSKSSIIGNVEELNSAPVEAVVETLHIDNNEFMIEKYKSLKKNKVVAKNDAEKKTLDIESPPPMPKIKYKFGFRTHTGNLDVEMFVPQSQKRYFKTTAETIWLDFQTIDKSSNSSTPEKPSNKRLKTPIFWLGMNGSRTGLYNVSPQLDAAKFIVVKNCDASSYNKCWPDHCLLVLPEKYNNEGVGCFKHAAQMLASHFHAIASEQQIDGKDVWPFVIILEDDLVLQKEYRFNSESGKYLWQDVGLAEFLGKTEKLVESYDSRHNCAIFGWPVYSQHSVSSRQSDEITNQPIENMMTVSLQAVSKSLMLNIQLLGEAQCYYNEKRFIGEDCDFVMRVAGKSNGHLKVVRLEDNALVYKSMDQDFDKFRNFQVRESGEFLKVDNYLIQAVDHPELKELDVNSVYLFEKYLQVQGNRVFLNNTPSSPVLEIDCYMDLGPKTVVEFISSDSTQKWSSGNEQRVYSGLLLSMLDDSKGARVKQCAKLLKKFQFIRGSTILIAGNSKNQLRRFVRMLDLEGRWSFKPNEEFMTVVQENNVFVIRGSYA